MNLVWTKCPDRQKCGSVCCKHANIVKPIWREKLTKKIHVRGKCGQNGLSDTTIFF